MQYINQINTKYYNFSGFFFRYIRLNFHVRGVRSIKTKVKNQKNILMQQQSLIINIGPGNIDFNTICDKNDRAN